MSIESDLIRRQRSLAQLASISDFQCWNRGVDCRLDLYATELLVFHTVGASNQERKKEICAFYLLKVQSEWCKWHKSKRNYIYSLHSNGQKVSKLYSVERAIPPMAIANWSSKEAQPFSILLGQSDQSLSLLCICSYWLAELRYNLRLPSTFKHNFQAQSHINPMRVLLMH